MTIHSPTSGQAREVSRTVGGGGISHTASSLLGINRRWERTHPFNGFTHLPVGLLDARNLASELERQVEPPPVSEFAVSIHVGPAYVIGMRNLVADDLRRRIHISFIPSGQLCVLKLPKNSLFYCLTSGHLLRRTRHLTQLLTEI